MKPKRSPESIRPFREPTLINIRFTPMKYRGWISTPTPERKSQVQSFNLSQQIKSHLRHRNIPTGQGLVFKSRWKFNSQRGAILLLHKPLMTRVPDEFLQHALHLPILKGKKLVHEIWECPGFYMYLSNRCRYSQPLVCLNPTRE